MTGTFGAFDVAPEPFREQVVSKPTCPIGDLGPCQSTVPKHKTFLIRSRSGDGFMDLCKTELCGGTIDTLHKYGNLDELRVIPTNRNRADRIMSTSGSTAVTLGDLCWRYE